MIGAILYEIGYRVFIICGTMLFGYVAYDKIRDLTAQTEQTKEDRSCSYLILGKQGSGKTFWAVDMFMKDVNKKKLGCLWMATQGIGVTEKTKITDYISPERVKDTILIKPYAKKPLGINMLRRYSNSSLEKELISDSVVTLFKRLFENIGDNMEGIIYSGTMALLTYGEKVKEKVSLWELYNFLNDSEYRKKVLAEVDIPVILDAFVELDNDRQQASLKALLRRFRHALSSESLLVFLSQKDNDIDLLGCVRNRKVVVCDLYTGGVGEDGMGQQKSSFAAELIVSKFQMIAETRNLNSDLYPLYLDEFQTYTSTAENVSRMIEVNRKRRMPVVLICQRLSQLSKALQEAVDNCATKYVFQTNHTDNELMSRKYPNFKNRFENFPKRVFLKDEYIGGKNYTKVDRTPDIEEPFGLSEQIERQCTGEKTRKELLKGIYETRKQMSGDDIAQE